jgi:hypothetical protein
MGGGCPPDGSQSDPLPDEIQEIIDELTDPQPGGDPSPPNPDPALPTVQKLGELLLGGNPKNIAVDQARNLGFVGVDKRIRRFDLANRSWKPLTSPGGVFYGLDERDDFIGQINPATGKITRIIGYTQSAIVPPLNAGFVTGMDYNPATGKLYVIDIFSVGAGATLFEVDPNTGTRTQIGDTGLNAGLGSVLSLARDPATGLLYTVTTSDTLWRIDPATATATEVSGAGIGFTNVQGLSFSPLDGKLYALNPPLNGPVQIITIDIVTGLGALVSELPLGFTGGSLAFKPDGTMWTVNLIGVTDTVMFTDSLIQIDYTTNPATIPTNFPTIEIPMVESAESHFQGIDSLCFAPEGGGDQIVPTFQNIDAVAVDNDGGVLASVRDTVFGFDPDFFYSPSGIDAGGLEHFLNIVVNPLGSLAYVRDGISGLVYEFHPGQAGVDRQIRYRPATTSFFLPQHPGAGIDPTTNRLFLVGDFQLHAVDLVTEISDEIDDGPNDNPVGVIVDHLRRRLHVNMQLDGPGGCSSIRTYHLDTLQVLGEICGSDLQIFNMAFDPVHNRIAANCRITAPSFDTRVRFFDMDTSTEPPFQPILLQTAPDNTNPASAFLAIDPDRNQLIVSRPDTPARLEFYQLPG